MSDKRLNEYRCTRSWPYRERHCIGHNDLGSRQGHYILAESEFDAILEMVRSFPGDGGDFTSDLSKSSVGCSRCREYNVLCSCKK
jgi:hypothetical protein